MPRRTVSTSDETAAGGRSRPDCSWAARCLHVHSPANTATPSGAPGACLPPCRAPWALAASLLLQESVWCAQEPQRPNTTGRREWSRRAGGRALQSSGPGAVPGPRLRGDSGGGPGRTGQGAPAPPSVTPPHPPGSAPPPAIPSPFLGKPPGPRSRPDPSAPVDPSTCPEVCVPPARPGGSRAREAPSLSASGLPTASVCVAACLRPLCGSAPDSQVALPRRDHRLRQPRTPSSGLLGPPRGLPGVVVCSPLSPDPEGRVRTTTPRRPSSGGDARGRRRRGVREGVPARAPTATGKPPALLPGRARARLRAKCGRRARSRRAACGTRCQKAAASADLSPRRGPGARSRAA